MSKEQIEEMAKILRVDDCFTVGINDCRKFNDCNICKATRLYNAGYRKQSEVAREIFGEIEIIGKVDNGVFLYHRELAELKKKYTGEV